MTDQTKLKDMKITTGVGVTPDQGTQGSLRCENRNFNGLRLWTREARSNEWKSGVAPWEVTDYDFEETFPAGYFLG